MDIARIQVLITQETEVGTFNDALYYSLEEWPNVTQEQRDSEKAQRVANWVNVIIGEPEEII